MFLVNPRDPVVLVRRALARTRRAACRSRNTMPRSSGRPRSASAYLDRDGKPPGDRGERHPRHLPAARDRSPRRHALHRLPVEAEARHGDQEVQASTARLSPDKPELCRAANPAPVRSAADAASPRLHGNAGFRGPDADRDHRPGPRRRGGLHPAAACRRARAWRAASRRCTRPPSASASRSRTPASLKAEGEADALRRASARTSSWSSPMARSCRAPSSPYPGPWLPQPPRLAAAALARRRPDRAGDHGRRHRDRRHGHAHGGRPRHRPGRAWSSASPSVPTRPRAS